MIELKNDTFKQELSAGNILLMFYTDWCPLCPPIIKMLSELENKQKRKKSKFVFAKINYDTESKAAEAYNIQGVPIVLAIRNGKILHGWGGLTKAEAYLKIVQEYFGKSAEDDSRPG